MKSRFEQFTQDELHTLATALKEAILKIEDRIKGDTVGSVYGYGWRCIWDADALLHEIMDSFEVINAGSKTRTIRV
jgi:hypothetical protein